MNELARFLTGRGHEVITLSSKPGKREIQFTDGGKRILHRQIGNPVFSRLRVQPTHTFFFSSLFSLISLEADVVHSLFYVDALAAAFVKRRRGCMNVVQMNYAPIPFAFHRRFPPDRWILRHVIQGADQRLACSQFVRRHITEHYGVDAEVIFPPVNLETFPFGRGPRNGRPTILSLADFDVRRKGVRVLTRAFTRVKQKVPSALLRLSGRMSPPVRDEVFGGLPESVRSDIEVLGLGMVEDIPSLYREASIMVLPAMGEPSGGVMLESWASGTPVVATNHGGLPEFMAEGVGVLFDPKTDAEETLNADGLAEAILEGLALSEREGTRENCREHATRYSWRALGPQIEDLYRL